MPDRFLKKWGLEMHPTTRPIPLAITSMGNGRPEKTVFVCEKDPDLYEGYKAVVDAHNAALDHE